MLVINQINQLSALIIIILIITVFFLLLKIKKKSKTIPLLKLEIELLRNKNLELTSSIKNLNEIDKTKFTYLTDISHQIRTCSNAIVGFTDFLTENNLNEDDKETFFQIIRNNNELLLNIIDDILDISIIEQGKLRIKKEPVSLHNLLKEIHLIFKDNKKLAKSHIDFTYYLDDNRNDLIIISDSFRLKQILINLINNAINYTESGQISFSYKIIKQEDQNFVCFKVDDSGIGIDPKYHGKIFDRFFKGPSNSSEKGLGLGLAIAKELVNQMGGDIWIQSELNIGSSFFFTIPFVLSQIEKSDI